VTDFLPDDITTAINSVENVVGSLGHDWDTVTPSSPQMTPKLLIVLKIGVSDRRSEFSVLPHTVFYTPVVTSIHLRPTI
jgi:hypothetical protein